ncbi:hypothetical protein QP999_09305 [Corynebacterium sp. MSK004]|uniref:hypothetical protein n=1 Tax=Corynebacterium sp. MSK004 TaxID=3050186 RepID=UPI00254FC733|nr:hypothetical protein [Corynebacterium sp. MSK004]MDK8898130.1 hypothetical protein [Corynebacterium sp. MSK004]
MNIIVTYVIAGVIHYEEHKDTLAATVGETGELNILERDGDTSRTYAPGVWKTIDYRDAP